MLMSNRKTIFNHLYVSTVIFVPVGTVYVRSIRQCHMSQIKLTILKLPMAKIALGTFKTSKQSFCNGF